MTVVDQAPEPDVMPGDVPVRPTVRHSGADRIFRGLALAAASVCLVIVTMTLVFLIKDARPALSSSGTFKFFTRDFWNPSAGTFRGLLD
jgi:ABC-type phosphate transport system permease subunit